MTAASPTSQVQGDSQAGAAELKRKGGKVSYQAKVQSVVVILGHGKIHCQGHTIGKDGEQDDGLEGSGPGLRRTLGHSVGSVGLRARNS